MKLPSRVGEDGSADRTTSGLAGALQERRQRPGSRTDRDAPRTMPAERPRRSTSAAAIADANGIATVDAARRSPWRARTALTTCAPRSARAVVTDFGPALAEADVDENRIRTSIAKQLERVLRTSTISVSPAEREEFIDSTLADMLGWGALTPLMADPDITEVMCNGPHTVYVERAGKITASAGALPYRRGAAPGRRPDARGRRPARRRGEPDGRRPLARRQPDQRDHPATVDRRHDPHGPALPRAIDDGRRPDRARSRCPPTPRCSSRRPCAASSTSSSPAVPRPVRRRCSTCSRRSSRTTSASSRSRTPPSSGSGSRTSSVSSRARRTPKAPAASRSATWSATRCACALTASSSARSAAARRSTCCRR